MKKVLIVLGYLLLFIGILGIFIPLLPTVPFLLLAASCFLKSSPRRYKQILRYRYVGSIISDYKYNKEIQLKSKIITLILLWGSISVSAFIFVENCGIKLLLLFIAVIVTIHILSYKSRKKDNSKPL